MGVISFSDSPEGTWSVAGWAFNQILDDLIKERSNDAEMVDKLEQAKLYSGLILYTLEPSFADRITRAISNVANGILSGTIRSGIVDQPYGNETTVRQYLESLEKLIDYVELTGKSL